MHSITKTPPKARVPTRAVRDEKKDSTRCAAALPYDCADGWLHYVACTFVAVVRSCAHLSSTVLCVRDTGPPTSITHHHDTRSGNFACTISQKLDLFKMSSSSAGSPEYLAETNDPGRDQRVSIIFIVIDTFFLLVFFASRYFNPKAVGVPMLVLNTLCYVFCMGSAATGICKSLPSHPYE